MKTGILKYPGGHGSNEISYILRTYFNYDAKDIGIADPGPFDLDLVFIPGGFPCRDNIGGPCYNDSPAIQALLDFAEAGKCIIGFGNGFQLLCELGLLPGRLERNNSGNFICKHMFVKPEDQQSIMTSKLDKNLVYDVPIASYFGRYLAKGSDLVKMRMDGQITFRYCDYMGRITEAVNFPGSTDNIAGICNEKKNVFGFLPQPERAVIANRGTADGKHIFSSILESV